jgi:hypothetical protein
MAKRAGATENTIFMLIMMVPVFFMGCLNLIPLQGFSQTLGKITAGQVSSTDSSFTIIHQNFTNVMYQIPSSWTVNPVLYQYDIDLDRDNETDLTFKLNASTSSNKPLVWIGLSPSGNAGAFEERKGIQPCLDSYTCSLDMGKTIGAEGSWSAEKSYLYHFYGFYSGGAGPVCGNWQDIVEKYAPVAKLVGQDTLYGWIKLSVQEQNNKLIFTVHESAIMKKNPLGITQPEKTRVRVFPNPASDFLQIQTDKPGGFITLMDKFGRVVCSTTVVHADLQLDVSRLSPGTYFLQYRAGDSLTRLKCILW